MADVKKGQSVFKKVAFSEKKKVLNAITEKKIQILLKGEINDTPFHLIAIQNEGHEAVLCHMTEDSNGVRDSQKVVINFTLDEDRYYMQTELGFKSGWAVIHMIGDLFQLQRRASVRVDIPKGVDATFMIRTFNGQAYAVESVVDNISAGGLKIRYATEEPIFKSGDIFQGTLHIGIKRPIDFDVEVRFASQQKFQSQTVHEIGLQFRNIDRIMETRLLSLIMDIQHEIYIKTQKGDIK